VRAPRHALWSGSSAALGEAATRLREEIPWLSAVFPDPDSASFYFWVVNFGLRERPDLLASLLPALPPEERMREISGSGDPSAFLNVGTQAAAAVFAALEGAGEDPYAPRRILDFGCGCGRVARHLLPLAQRGELVGCDIDAEAIAYCRAALVGARFLVNRAEPPLAEPKAAFDLVYSISVFTHLALEPSRLWAAELRRVLAPGGHAAITVHGEHSWRRLGASEALRREFGIRERALEQAERTWRDEGFVQLEHIVPSAWDHPEPYGLTFVRAERLPELWPGWRLAAYLPGAISDWQDLALFVAGAAAEDSTGDTATRQ